MKFTVNNPGYELSPYTGMNREHWLELSHFFLEGIFQHIKHMEDPILVSHHKFDASYPRPGGPKWRLTVGRFEELVRSFLIAAPLLHNEPDAMVCGYFTKEYYKQQILLSTTLGTPNHLLRVEEIFPEAESGVKVLQHTCECVSLVIDLTMCKEVVWDSYTVEEKTRTTDYLSNFGHSYTGRHDWRLSNMLILALLNREGYPVDQGAMRGHAQVVVSYYVGNGWYHDGRLFDYYCPWAFHVYGPPWNQWYGYEREPYLATKIEQYSHELVETYPHAFDGDGHVTMWGRSGTYRSVASAPLTTNLLFHGSKVDPGWARRITSGAVLQFAIGPECFYEGILYPGFYELSQSLVQTYSRAASPFWLANVWVCLMLPKDHPFWTAKKHNGVWETMPAGETHTEVLDGLVIIMDNHRNTDITEFRTVRMLTKKDNPSLNTYSRLSFNNQFPWEDFDWEGVEIMQYSLTVEECTPGGKSRSPVGASCKTQKGILPQSPSKTQTPSILMYGGIRNGTPHRKEYFDFDFTFQDRYSIDLADSPVSNGPIRADKVRIPDKPYTPILGAYGMADCGDIKMEVRDGQNTFGSAVILKSGEGQVAFASYDGWDEIDVCKRKGVSPVAEESRLVYGISRRKKYHEYLPYIMVSAVLTKKDQLDQSEEELFPIEEVRYTDETGCGGLGPVALQMKDGRCATVDFEGTEGRLSI